MHCPSCKRRARSDSKFCAYCGTALNFACRACGHTNRCDANFCTECGSAPDIQDSQPAAKVAPAPTAEGPLPPERRQLTIVFCDMVGSSALSTRLDAEEQREVVSAFQGACASEIKRLDGMVAQYFGDGVLAYFGYPSAHEDDAERAVRASLAIIGSITALKPAENIQLQARIGIATGIVIVGDLTEGSVTQEHAAIGETTNLAARAQAVAEPGTVVICPKTHQLIGALFEYRDLGLTELKGFPNRVHLRRVLGASSLEDRFEARHTAGAPGMLGREERSVRDVRRA
jgi:class 3 adenylate cyclase